MNIYDIIIIGGGISGLHSAYKLSQLNNKILLFDNRNYLGGRILTYYDKNCHYELGAGRFNNNHKNLLKLIKKFNLSKIKINDNTDYRDKYKIIDNKIFYIYIKKIVIKLNKINPDILKKYTFKELCYKYFEKKKINTIIKYFGYKSEFEILNAYNAIKSFMINFMGNNKYYVLKEGMSELCNRINKECLKNNVEIKINSLVTDINNDNDLFKITTNNENYYCYKIIFAIKKNDLMKFNILQPIYNNLNSVNSAPLLRIYAYYPIINNKVWFSDYNKMVTNTKLKFIIPINKNYGIIMISYTDNKDTLFFLDNDKLKKDQELILIINHELKKIFKIDIPNPIKLNSYYWKYGCHYWKKNYNSDIISKYLINPLNNIYICGESYSLNQAWIEGALETSNKVLKLINKN